MNVLILIHSLAGGGAERVTSTLANYWADKGWTITIVTMAGECADFYELQPSVKRIALQLTSESSNSLIGLAQNLRRVFALRQVLHHIKPDIALGMMTSANVMIALAALGKSIGTVGSERIHPPQYPLGWIWESLRRHTYGLLDSIVAQTEESSEWIIENTNTKRVAVIPNMANWPLLIQDPILIPIDLCGIERNILLAVGRLETQKGFDDLINVFALIADTHPNWDLVILGEGVLRCNLEEKIRILGLSSRVYLYGRVGNVGEWYERADIYVMSSHFEGFPNTLVEAMAYGLPVVSFDCDTGPRDIIRHEENGLLVPNGDIKALTATLVALMSDRERRARLGCGAIEVRQRFSMIKIAHLWETLFKQICLKS